MKYLKYFLPGILFLFGFCIFSINVKADTVEFDYTRNYVSSYGNQGFSYINLEKFYSDYNVEKTAPDIVDNLYELVYNYYIENYKEEYPYYFVSIIPWANNGKDYVISSNIKDILIHATLIPLKEVPTLSTFKVDSSSTDNLIGINAYYRFSDTTTVLPTVSQNGTSLSVSYNKSIFNIKLSSKYEYIYNPLVYYSSNFNLIYDLEDTYVIKGENGKILNTYTSGNIIPPYKDSSLADHLVEVNLNSYPYIALSLKDYSKTEEFSVTNYVKGQYCLSPVYDYGLKERKDVLTGTKIQRCSLVYTDFTPVRTSILKSDLENHAIYYLKAYNTNIENKVKIDTSVFNIHYITEEEKDNPILTINGKKYSVLPYDNLTDSSTKSEDEGYASGGSCAVGDFNCTASMAGSNFKWSDIFTSPLEFIKGIWSSVTQIFIVIGYFISLLPAQLQYFFYISFTLAIVLGIIKIIL